MIVRKFIKSLEMSNLLKLNDEMNEKTMKITIFQKVKNKELEC